VKLLPSTGLKGLVVIGTDIEDKCQVDDILQIGSGIDRQDNKRVFLHLKTLVHLKVIGLRDFVVVCLRIPGTK